MIEQKESLQEYEAQVYMPATSEFINNVMTYCSKNQHQIEEEIENHLDSFIEKIGRMQRIQPIPAGQITISLLRTSIWNEKPRIRFDCFDVGKEAGKNIAYQYINIEWLNIKWKAFEDKLTKMTHDKGYDRIVRKAQIQQYMSKALDRLLKLFGIAFKYTLSDVDLLPHYNELIRDEVFLLTAGEYMDWQRILFAEVPEIDIIANPNNKPLLFQKISEKKYRDKVLKDIDLTQSRFINCEFSKCVFEQVNLIDARFINCLFRDVNMNFGKMYGASFINCVFINIQFNDMKQCFVPFENDKQGETDIYRNTCFINCVRDDKRMQQEGES